MESTTEDFGQERLATLPPLKQDLNLFSLYSVGWHRCNDRYHISRPEGCDVHLLLFTIRGCGTLQIRNQKFNLPAGTIALVPRDTCCSYYTPPKGVWEFYWMHPAGDMATNFLDSIAKSNHFLAEFEPGYNYQQQLEELLSLCTEHPQNFEWELSQKLSELLHHFAIMLFGRPSMPSLSRRAISYIERNFWRSISLEDIAQTLFVSPTHLIRIFKKETGRTPHQYLTQYRLLIAAQLLEFSDQQVDEISVQTGFSSSSHFISQFKSQFGCTPLQYREKISDSLNLSD